MPVLLFLFALCFCLPSAYSKNSYQQPLMANTATASPANFSVGFSLHSSYGAAAITFSYPDGQLETHTTVYHGNFQYREVMARLSLDSSIHIAPPYNDDGEFYEDWPRQAARTALKIARLPASYDVGVLADVLRQLRSQLEGSFGIVITEAVFTCSHAIALYQDDMEDAAIHLGIRYVTPKREHNALVWETAAVYAGHGRGLCKTWYDDDRCHWEIYNILPDISALSVHYSRNALTVSLARMRGEFDLFEPPYRHAENYTLGRDALADYSSVEKYWDDVEAFVLIVNEFFPGFEKPDVILVNGDAIDREFIDHVESAMLRHMGRVPEILSDEPVTVAAKGAAELMRRGPAFWSH